MQKFFIIATAILFVVLGIYYAVYEMGFYIELNPNAIVSTPFRAKEKSLERQNSNGEYTPFVLRGVEVSPSLAGHLGTEFALEEEDYLRWLEYIGEMGANSVRVSLVMDDDFYNALYTYNTTHDYPLYLLQGISLPDLESNNANDAYGEGFFDQLIKNGKSLVDIIHGRKNITVNNFGGSGAYRRDISQWVAGYIVGSDWVPDTVAYTDNGGLHSAGYQGRYFETSDEATVFETMLARVMDSITSYETAKYRTQRPIGFVNSPASDFLDYSEVYARQLLKYAQIDAEAVMPTELMRAGTFAAYTLYSFCPNFISRLSEPQKTELAPIIKGLDTGSTYDGYIDLLAKYHSMPVVAAGYGFSSSRGSVQESEKPLTEQEQGKKLSALSLEIETLGWAGGFISTWQDEWNRRTWNTAFSSHTGRSYLWHNIQTDGQCYGLLAFEPGAAVKACIIDGKTDEWSKSDFAFEHNGIRVSFKYDEEGLYLLVQKQGLTPKDILYLPIDVSPNVGSLACQEPSLSFENPADFLLCLSGLNNSRLLVYEYYNAVRQQFLFNIEGRDPFIDVPNKESRTFIPINIAVENHILIDIVTSETRMPFKLKARETGKLTHGIGDPKSAEYNSLADFCYGQDAVEIRLPWMLLNFYDPSGMQVHDNYYDNFGVEGISIKSIYIGASETGADTPIPMSRIMLKGWGDKVDSHERLKQSYYILKESWCGRNGN